MQKFSEQANQFGAKMEYADVLKIEKEKENFTVKTQKGDFFGRTIILACGLSPRNLKIPGEKELKGKGVSYCATCDAPLYKRKNVAVIGGGNSALDAAELLARIAEKVYLIHRSDQFRGEEIVVERIKKDPKIEMVLSSEIVEIKGDNTVKSILIKNNGHDDTKELAVNGVFVEIGYIAETDFIKDLVDLNAKGEIITDKDSNTSQAGVFAGGDVTDGSYKQIVISAGEGAKAALQAYKYLQNP